jgi:imidazolonepropionase-like amidohydrolase
MRPGLENPHRRWKQWRAHARSHNHAFVVSTRTSSPAFAGGHAHAAAAVLLAVLSTAVTALAQVAQTPSARNEAMPLLRDESRVALRNVRIVDGTGAPARQNQTLIIESGRIRAVGNAAEIAIPEGTRTLDLDGRTVLPSFVMLHEHLMGGGQPDVGSSPQSFSAPRLYLAFGVTTIRTAGTEHPYVDLNLKRRIDRGEVPGPEMHLTSPFFNGEDSPFLADKIVRDAEDARRAVRYWAAEGFTSFKVYQSISKDTLAAIIDEAHRVGLPVTAHLRSVTCREAVELGIDNLEHALGPCTRLTQDDLGTSPDSPRAQDFIRLLIARKVVLTLTPVTRNLALSQEQLELLHPVRRERYEREQAAVADGSAPSGRQQTSVQLAGQLTLAFARAGGRVVIGSDPNALGEGRMPGLAGHDTLKQVVRIGFNPLETIRMATLDGATFLGISDRTGSIAVGKEADVQVVRGTPDQDIRDIDNVEIVFANGVPYDPELLLSRVKGLVGLR